MNIVSVQNLSKSKGEKELFKSIGFGINQGQKIALIGVNGCGKSTLLKLLAGIETADEGEVSVNNEIRIKFLNQITEFNENHTIFDHIYFSDAPLVRLLKSYDLVCQELAGNYTQEAQEKLDKLTTEMDRLEAWQFENEVKSVLGQLGLNDLSVPMKSLSGGMLKKVALAQAIIDSSDLLILDEPTNHLDIDTIEWLEGRLKKMNKTILMVTHDRYFLDSVCNTIMEIDQHDLFVYQGNYSYYLEKKEERLSTEKQQSEKIKNLLRTEVDWLRRQPKARGTKQKARIDKIKTMMNHKHPVGSHNFVLTVNGRRLGRKIIELDSISKSFDKNIVVQNFSYVFKQNERIGIVGPNGSGKSTFLNLLTGTLKPDSGERNVGLNTHFGYFSQHSFQNEDEKRVIDYIKESGEVIDIGGKEPISAGRFLEYFLFPSYMHYSPISKLSGGEKRRLHLVKILMSNPNFLVLDEPTNDLDVQTLTLLESFLETYQGCVVIVSHDRYFMDKCVDQLFLFSHGSEIKAFPGNYSDYLFVKNEDVSEAASIEKTKHIPQRKKDESRKMTFNEKKEFERLEIDIDLLEVEKNSIETFFNKPVISAEEMNEKAKRYKLIKEILTEKMSRWEELAELI